MDLCPRQVQRDDLKSGNVHQELSTLLKKYHIQSVLDARCGNFNWMRQVCLDEIKYIGVDMANDLIQMNQNNYSTPNRSFLTLDIISNQLPQCDLIFCRDYLVHLPYESVFKAIQNFKNSGAKYLLTTTFLAPRHNHQNMSLGGWHPLNLMAPPFNFPSPIQLLNEQCMEESGTFTDKSLALWKLDDLKTQMKIAVMITSVIKTSPQPLVYITRSIFSPEERFKQTLQSISSVRKQLIGHDYKIYLIEGSELDEAMETELKSQVDYYINVSGIKSIKDMIDSPLKGYGEAGQTHYCLQNYLVGKDYDLIFKLSGRYFLESFNLKQYDLKIPTFCTGYGHDPNILSTVLYCVPYSLLETYTQSIGQIIQTYTEYQKAKCFEPHTLPYYERLVPAGLHPIKIISKCGVAGCVSVCPEFYRC
jgi:hypothetical protein